MYKLDDANYCIVQKQKKKHFDERVGNELIPPSQAICSVFIEIVCGVSLTFMLIKYIMRPTGCGKTTSLLIESSIRVQLQLDNKDDMSHDDMPCDDMSHAVSSGWLAEWVFVHQLTQINVSSKCH